ncbi:RNA polymerase factor sigma-54 [Shouchella patagoniensis]|uniref:RNA polymerase factor sigma-54 n=1 Tax=Shouchella patagoniensis TaxID=228576 RepID=UPI000994D127|nr:RNA polymerase factor sigma-54 [Shouchella patagoniensis]
MEIGLYQKQTTNLVMTQELRQAIYLLQYSTMDVCSYLEEQALENPLLELREPARQENDEMSRFAPSMSSDEKHAALENLSTEVYSLNQHLRSQLVGISGLSQTTLQHLHYLIDSLRDDGYLSDSIERISTRLGIGHEAGERLLHLLQALEPAGVGARCLGECIALQLKKHSNVHPLAAEMALTEIGALAERKWKQLAKKFDISIQEIQLIYDQIKQMDPKPGLAFYQEPTVYAAPDVYITGHSNEVVVYLNSDVLPSIRIQEEYKRLLEEHDETKQYAKQKGQHVDWLKKSLEQRQQTILRVTEVLANVQRDYLFSQNGTLKPLTLFDIAQELDIHESTVSRATAHKYAQTPKGLIELKTLFTANISKTNGALTNQSVKAWLKELINAEDKQKPLSDQKLVERLKEDKQISLSRRVIAKYRDELGILSSAKRKRYDERVLL